MSREYPYALDVLFEIFTPKDGLYWFIESKSSNKWVTSYFPNNSNAHKEEHLTIIPTEALRFETHLRLKDNPFCLQCALCL